MGVVRQCIWQNVRDNVIRQKAGRTNPDAHLVDRLVVPPLLPPGCLLIQHLGQQDPEAARIHRGNLKLCSCLHEEVICFIRQQTTEPGTNIF